MLYFLINCEVRLEHAAAAIKNIGGFTCLRHPNLET